MKTSYELALADTMWALWRNFAWTADPSIPPAHARSDVRVVERLCACGAVVGFFRLRTNAAAAALGSFAPASDLVVNPNLHPGVVVVVRVAFFAEPGRGVACFRNWIRDDQACPSA